MVRNGDGQRKPRRPEQAILQKILGAVYESSRTGLEICDTFNAEPSPALISSQWAANLRMSSSANSQQIPNTNGNQSGSSDPNAKNMVGDRELQWCTLRHLDSDNIFITVEPLLTQLFSISNNSVICNVINKRATHIGSSGLRSGELYKQWSANLMIVLPKYMDGFYKECIEDISLSFGITYALPTIYRFNSMTEFCNYIENGPFRREEINELKKI